MENTEMSAILTAITESKSASDNLITAYKAESEAKNTELQARLTAMEQKASSLKVEAKEEVKSFGAQLIASDDFKDMIAGKSRSMQHEVKAVFTSPSLVAPTVGSPVAADVFPYKLRSFLRTAPVSTDLVKVAQESSFTNNAAGKAYGATGNESEIAITLVDFGVKTIEAHINIAKENLADAPAFAAFVDSRMRWGLAAYEESQLLLGSGLTTNLKGLYTAGTAKSFTSETLMDRIALAIADVWATGHVPTFVVMTPADYAKVNLEKSTTGSYLIGNPASGFGPTVWGLPVVVSNKMTANHFLVGSIEGAYIAERQGTVLSVSYENNVNFTSGIVTVMAEQREALCIEVPGSFITGICVGVTGASGV